MGRIATAVTRVAVALLVAGVAEVATSCGPDHHPVFEVDRPIAGADEAVHIRVTGLSPGGSVDVTATAKDYADRAWSAHATFTADDEGVVDLNRDAARAGGSYAGVDGMGLFSSMTPVDPRDDVSGFAPTTPEIAPEFEVTLAGLSEGSHLDSVSLRRLSMKPGETHRTLTPDRDGISGELYLPVAGGPTGSGVLLIGGSEGGGGPAFQAALLASHGYPALAVGYFALPGLPATLHDIPIEYFATAAKLLPGPVRVVGYSRGTEAALLLSALYPSLVDAIVLCAPADHVWGPFPPTGNAWTYRGMAQNTIPFDAIRGRVLALAGSDDRLWPSAEAAATVARRTGGAFVVYAGAGHAVCIPPYFASSTTLVHPVTGTTLNLGGTPQQTELARRQTWQRLLGMLGPAR